nr:MAG TPA: hypothetical protein [Bacteriophage sp.]
MVISHLIYLMYESIPYVQKNSHNYIDYQTDYP